MPSTLAAPGAPRPVDGLARLGDQLIFHLKALALDVPRAIRRYRKRDRPAARRGQLRLRRAGGHRRHHRRDGRLSLFTGTVVGLQGYAALDQIGTSTLTGFISAYFNTREIAPLVAGLALSATVGSGFTAQLGAMRISEEIDALEVMADPQHALPGDLPDRRRPRRGHPALRHRAADLLPRLPARSPSTSTASPPAPTTTTSACSCHRGRNRPK